jgi:hypothetical protein
MSLYTQVQAVSHKYFVPKLHDNIFDSNFLMKRAKDKFLHKIDGGERIMIPLEYAQITASGWFNDLDLLSTTDNQTVDSAELYWKQIYANITISRREELQNSGKAQVINLAKSKMRTAEKTMSDQIGTGLYHAGTTTNAIIGLQAWVNTSSTVGGISQTSHSWWQCGSLDSTTTTLSLSAMQSVYNACTIDSEQPTVIVCGRTVFNLFYSLLTPVQRFTDKDSAKAGFSSLYFNGCVVGCDSKATALNMFVLNENSLMLFGHSDEWFRLEDFQKPTNQNAKTAKLYSMMALGCNNNRLNGRLSAIAA